MLFSKLFTKLNIVSKPKNHIEGNAVKVTLFQKAVTNITNNITEGKKSNKYAGITAIITILAYVLAMFYPENKISKILIDNSLEIASVIGTLVLLLTGGIGKKETDN